MAPEASRGIKGGVSKQQQQHKAAAIRCYTQQSEGVITRAVSRGCRKHTRRSLSAKEEKKKKANKNAGLRVQRMSWMRQVKAEDAKREKKKHARKRRRKKMKKNDHTFLIGFLIRSLRVVPDRFNSADRWLTSRLESRNLSYAWLNSVRFIN